MIGVIVATHGRVAAELVDAARRIVGDIGDVEAISIGWSDDADDARERLKAAVDKLASASGVLILTDMFGGTPTNIALSFLEPGRVEVVTGVNLPMLIKLTGGPPDEPLGDLANKLRSQAQRSIYVASEVLARMES